MDNVIKKLKLSLFDKVCKNNCVKDEVCKLN